MLTGKIFGKSVLTAALFLFAGSGLSANAHAIIELNGVDAVAGKRSAMTMEIQHGCTGSGTGTIQVIAYVGKPWGKITPKEVDGWKSKVKRTAKGGQQITWDNLGEPQPFNQPFFLPMNISWPKKKGTYSMKVTQVCPDEVMVWGTPDGPATANKPSPPLTPLPQVQVVEKVKVS